MKATEMLHILKTQNKRLFIVWLVTFIAFIDNVIVDTFDCSNRMIKCCWQIM